MTVKREFTLDAYPPADGKIIATMPYSVEALEFVCRNLGRSLILEGFDVKAIVPVSKHFPAIQEIDIRLRPVPRLMLIDSPPPQAPWWKRILDYLAPEVVYDGPRGWPAVPTQE